MSFPIKGEEPGAFVLTAKKDGEKYVMSERTLSKLREWLTEDEFDALFIGEWVVLDKTEQKLAEEIRQRWKGDPK